MKFAVRGQSQTTFTKFGSFWPPTPLGLHFLWYESLQKVNFFDHLPPSSCKRGLWTPPKSKFFLTSTNRASKCTYLEIPTFRPQFNGVRKSWFQRIILQYVNIGKYCFILQKLILGLFAEVLLVLILMLSIQNLILVYWYFQYFTVLLSYGCANLTILYHLFLWKPQYWDWDV